MRWSHLGWVVLGGSAGTALRLAAEAELPRPSDLPLPTLVVNLAGAFVLGALLERLSRGPAGGDDDGAAPPARDRRQAVRLLVGTGFCGGLTTYSTFAVEVDLLLAGSPAVGAAYAAGTVALGLLAAGAVGRRRRPVGGRAVDGSGGARVSAVVVVLAVLAGGLGAGTRYLVDAAVRRRWAAPVPLGTTLINTTGSFGLGLLTGLAAAQAAPGALVVVLGTGFLGGYTTFSTASVEVVALLREGRRGAAALHAVVMLGGSVVAAAAGLATGAALG